MSQLKGACIIGQSGGPTSVINASAYGVIRTALDSGCITKVYGAAHGIKGVLDDVLYDMARRTQRNSNTCSTPPPPLWAPAATSSRTAPRTTLITSAFWRYSRSTTCATSSTTAATTPWTPATRYPNTCSPWATSAA